MPKWEKIEQFPVLNDAESTFEAAGREARDMVKHGKEPRAYICKSPYKNSGSSAFSWRFFAMAQSVVDLFAGVKGGTPPPHINVVEIVTPRS